MAVSRLRGLVMGLPGVVEKTILDRLVFQVRGRTFATEHWPEQGAAVVKLLSEDRVRLTDGLAGARLEPGSRGRNGVVVLQLFAIDEGLLAEILLAAWRCAYGEAVGRRVDAREVDVAGRVGLPR